MCTQCLKCLNESLGSLRHHSNGSYSRESIITRLELSYLHAVMFRIACVLNINSFCQIYNMTKKRPKPTVAERIWGGHHLLERADWDASYATHLANCQIREMCLGEYPLPIAGPAQTPTSTPPTVTNAQKMSNSTPNNTPNGPSDGWCGIYCVLLQLPYHRYFGSVLDWLDGLAVKLEAKISTTVDSTSSLFPSPSPDIPLAPLSPPPQPSLSPPGPHGADPLQHQ